MPAASDKLMRSIAFTHSVSRWARPAFFVFAAVLQLAPALHAQSEALKKAPDPQAQPGAPLLYSMKFSGGNVSDLQRDLKAAFPKDNVIFTPSSEQVRLNLAGFEIRDARLKEVGKTIEFVTDGQLIVEVAEESGVANIWRIGSRLATGPGTLLKLKMRSVAAPHLFQDKEKAEKVRKDASDMEARRLMRMVESARAGANDVFGEARIELLTEQNIFVIIGTEEGIEGMESIIKAAEQLAADEEVKRAALAASLAPTMRAVLAPHLFDDQVRLDRVTQEFENVQKLWYDSHLNLMQMVGLHEERRGGVRVQQRRDQKLFVLIGSERDIAGMESLIQAAEKNAADEDAAKKTTK